MGVTVTFDSSILLDYYASKGGYSVGTSGSAASGGATGPAKPTPPWSGGTAAQLSARTQAVLHGGRVIDPVAAKLDISGGDSTANQNYKNLFALYQGLNVLSDLAQRASDKSVSPVELAQLQNAFQSGQQQVQTYLGTKPFTGFQVVQGDESALAKTTTGVAHETDTYTTATIASGSSSAEVPALQGDVRFGVTVTKASGTQVNVAFDLSEMGSTPRTIGNVVNYLNGKLQDANLATRFASVRTAAVPVTAQIGGKTVVTSPGQDQFALQVKGISVEDLSFSAPATDPAVYLAQSTGTAAAPSTSTSKATTSTLSQQLIKFDASATPLATSAATGQVFKQDLGVNASGVHAITTAPDGSVYVLADVTATTAGQPIQGAQDVALTKYDPAGKVVFTRTLGAADSASGLALAVSADGSQVAIAGTTAGDLDPSDGVTVQTSGGQPVNNAFVTVFDGQGQELWTKQTAAQAGAAVQPNAVTFGPNDMVYVAGQTDGSFKGSSSAGRTDAYVQSFHAVSVPLHDGSGASEWVVTNTQTSQFGSGSADHASGVVVSGSSVYVSSVENGRAIVRKFDQSGTGSTSLTAGTVRDLGDLQGGSVAGLAVNQDGSIVVAGSTHNGALDAGTVTQGYTDGKEGFIASLSPDLQPSGSDALTYLGAATDQSISAVTTSGGKVFVTGQIATTPVPGSGVTSAFDGYAAQVDPLTGQVGWTQRYVGQDRQAAPVGIAVGQTGASVLDKLGLPTGAMDFSVSAQLVANSSLRPGDQFFIKSGLNGHPVAVKIDANETYKSLAVKIARASGFNAVATVLSSTAGDQLQIKPSRSSAQIQIIAGPNGADALGALGLKEGVVSGSADQMNALAPVTTPGSTAATSSIKNGYALKLPSNLDLSSAAGIKAAQASLANAISTVRSIYRDMTTPPPAKTVPGSSGAVPKYLTDQIANYQAALSRLTGGS